MNSTAMEQIEKYWGPWQSTRSSREEQAFAWDAAAHLGGCVWPPRSYSCSFCKREFRSAQALGGHMNVHRRDRALLRQQGSSSLVEDGQEAAAPQLEQQPQQGPSLLYRAAASNPSITSSSLALGAVPATKGDDVNRGTASPPSYLESIIKESKSKLFMLMRLEATSDQCEHDDDDVESAGRMKRRRRLGPPSSVTLPIFAQTTTVSMVAESGSQRVDHAAKVPGRAIIISNPSSIIPPLVDQQEVDLELRLGTTPKVT